MIYTKDMKITTSGLEIRHIAQVAVVTFLILLMPAVGMQLSSDVNWSLSDFLVAGTLLFVMGTALQMIVHVVQDKQRRLLFVSGLLLLFAYVWAELAVGIFTHWGS